MYKPGLPGKKKKKEVSESFKLGFVSQYLAYVGAKPDS